MTGACPATSAGGTKPDEEIARGALGPAGWLGLAATPTFALMALLTAVSDEGAMDVLCQGGHGSALTGMVAMYLLMSAFHSAPWLKLLRHRGRGAIGG